MKQHIRGQVALSTEIPSSEFYQDFVFSTALSSEEQLAGQTTGDVEGSPAAPDALYSPTHYLSPVLVNTDKRHNMVIIDYQDQLQKPLGGYTSYRVKVILAYAEKNDEIEKLPPAERAAAYERAIRTATSGFNR